MYANKEQFEILKESTKVDSEIIEATITKLKEFTSSFSQFIQDVSQLNSSLQTPTGSSKHAFKKKQHQETPEVDDSAFSIIWSVFVEKFLSLNYGIQEFNNHIKDTLLSGLQQLKKFYTDATAEMIDIYQTAAKALQTKEETFREQYSKYQKHCERLEVAHGKQESDPNSPEFNDLKKEFKEIQDKAVVSHAEYSEELSNFHLSYEQILAKYEHIERLREEKLNEFFSSFAVLEKELTERKQSLAQVIRHDFENALSQAEAEKISVPDDSTIDQIVTFEPIKLPDDVEKLLSTYQS